MGQGLAVLFLLGWSGSGGSPSASVAAHDAARPALPTPSPRAGIGEPVAPPVGRQEASIALDRWLVSDPILLEGEDPAAALDDDRLPIETRRDVFPDRDLEIAGTYWRLVRDDSSATLDLDRAHPGRPERTAAYAHAYIWSPDDRTVGLRWRGPVCGAARLRLNAQVLVPSGSGEAAEAAEPTAPAGGAGARAMAVRLGLGWNTLLAEVAAGDCPFRLEARLHEVDALTERGDEGARGLEGVRVQASRPPGVRRTWPRAYVTLADPAIGETLRWHAGERELRADLLLEVAPWGARSAVAARAEARAEEEEGRERGLEGGRRRPPPGPPGGGPPGGAPPDEPVGQGAESERERLAGLRDRLLPPPPRPEPAPTLAAVQVRAGGARDERDLDLGGPAEARMMALPFEVADLRRAARSGTLEVRLRFTVEGEERRVEGRLPLAADPRLLSPGGSIELVGWNEADGLRGGEWRVPAALAGRALDLSTEGAPGRWTVNGEPAPEGRTVPLCAPCREGRRIRLEVAPTGEWTGSPLALVREG